MPVKPKYRRLMGRVTMEEGVVHIGGRGALPVIFKGWEGREVVVTVRVAEKGEKLEDGDDPEGTGEGEAKGDDS